MGLVLSGIEHVNTEDNLCDVNIYNNGTPICICTALVAGGALRMVAELNASCPSDQEGWGAAAAFDPMKVVQVVQVVLLTCILHMLRLIYARLPPPIECRVWRVHGERARS